MLAVVVALALALPAVGLAWADDEQERASVQLGAGSIQAFDADAEVWDGAIDVSWFVGHEDDSSYTLTKPAQLAGLAAIVNGTADVKGVDVQGQVGLKFTGKTVRLGADIALNAAPATGFDSTGTQRSWTPIGDLILTGTEPSSDGGTMPHYDDRNYFDGTFDGAGHVVKNLYIYNNVEGTYGGVQALFANVGGNAVIQNVGIEGGFVSGRVAAGLVAISHATKDAYPHIIGCFNTANIAGNGSSTRGVAGIFAGEEQYRSAEDYHGGAYIANCYNTGTISRYSSSNAPAGGIAGTGSVQIYGCYNTGVVNAASLYSGALAGNLIAAGSKVGQGSAAAFEGASCVRDSYALEGSIPADERGQVKLYNLIDATHYKGGSGENSPAVSNAETAAFKDAAWFAGDECPGALSQSFVRSGAAPSLYWQSGQVQWDFERIDTTYNVSFYEVWAIPNQTYTGSDLKPAVTVSYRTGSGDDAAMCYLHEGSDFTVAYKDNREIGSTATVTVTGMGRFFGKQATTFKIIDSSLASTEIEPIGAQWYYGEPVVPQVVVHASNGDVLTEGVDYNVEFAGNVVPDGKQKSTATVTIAPTDSQKFTGSKSVEFTVLRASSDLQDADGDGYYEIGSKADLQFLAWATSDAEGSAVWGERNFELTADIDATSSDATYMQDRPADPLFTHYAINGDVRTGGFGGTFDGAGHTVTLGLDEQGPSLDLHPTLAFMVYTKYNGSATFKDLTLDGSVKCPHGAAAGFLIMGQPGTIAFSNCANRAQIQGDAYYSGSASGFITQTSTQTDLLMEGCENTGTIASASSRAAGFVGALGGQNVKFRDCANSGSVTSGSMDGAAGFACVALGAASDKEATGQFSFVKCVNSGRIYVRSGGDVGGILANCAQKLKSLELVRCVNTGEISYTGSGDIGGGLVGRTYNPTTILNCYNNAAVKARGSEANQPGGLVGYIGNGDNEKVEVSIRNAYAAGDLGKGDSQGGGLVGTLWLHTTLSFDNVYYDSDTAKVAIAYNFGEKWPSAVDPPIVNGQAAGVDGNAMKAATFATMLGAAFGPDAEQVNGGLPVLLAADAASRNLADGAIEAPDTLAYTGAPVRLEGLTVRDAEGALLEEGTDYVVFYSADGAQGRAIVEGIGSYSGSIEHTFAIQPCLIQACTIPQVNAVNYADFAGGEVMQDLHLTSPSGRPMVQGSDYQVSYANNVGAGVAYVRIEGKAPYYAGSVMRLFTVAPGDLGAIAVRGIDAHYPYSQGSGGLYVYEELYAPNGYRLSRSDSPTDKKDYIRLFFDDGGNLVTDSSGAAAVSLRKAGTYTVVLRGSGVDASGTNWNNGNWAGEASATFTYGNRMALDANVTGVDATYGFTGEAIQVKPNVSNKFTGYALTEGSDYKVSYKLDGADVPEVRDPGDYTLVITGRDAWFGTKEVSFTVVPSQYYIGEGVQVQGIQGRYFHTGEPICPKPTSVSIGEKALDALSEYAVSYENAVGDAVPAPTEPGTYYVVVAGLEPYKGAKRVPFTIEEPFISVYTRQGDEPAKLVRSFAKDEFVSLKSAGGAVSALYCDQEGSNWRVATAADYVTLDDLLGAAGVAWTAGESVTYGGDGSKSATTFTYEQVQQMKFYPATTATATETLGGVPAPFVLSISDASSRIGDGGTTYASEAELANLASVSSENAPRAIMGVLPGDYVNAKAKAANMRGQRLWNKTRAITVMLPAASSGQGAGQAAGGNAGGAGGASGSNAGTASSGGSAAVGAGGAGSGTGTALAGAGAASVKAPSAVSTPAKAKAANPMTVKGKTVKVSFSKLKKKNQSFKVSKTLKVKKAKGKVRYKLVSVNKKAAKKKVVINKKTGKLTVKKGLKKGTYKVRVKVTAAGNAGYKAKSKTVTVTLKVR